MPHFVIDCSAPILSEIDERELNQMVFEIAKASGLFDHNDIKVRVNSYQTYLLGGNNQNFIHVFASIMQGRTTEQRAALSKAIVSALCQRLPEVTQVAMNINEFEKATYCNRKMI